MPLEKWFAEAERLCRAMEMIALLREREAPDDRERWAAHSGIPCGVRG
jgi:hypothetical protein